VPNIIPVVVNTRSGPAGTDDGGARIAAAFAARGLQAKVTVLQPGQDIAGIVDRLLEEGATTLVAGGGDGTLNAIAARLLDREVTLGVLPLGTLNHFARDLGIPFDLDDAVRVIAEGHEASTDVGEVNHRIFLNNSSIGLYPRIVIEREHAQRHLHVGKWPALARATWHALRAPANFSARVCVDGETIEHRTPFIFAGNNDYVLEGFGIGRRTRLDGGVLCLYVLRPKTTFGFLWLGIRALFGIGSHAGDFDVFHADGFEVHGRGDRNEVATDGEVTAMTAPICYSIRKRALRVFAPQPAAAQEAG
jgi:diacylglycerol kinase family enzyme